MIYLESFSRPRGIKGREKYLLEHEAGLGLLARALEKEFGISGLTADQLERIIDRKPGGKPWLPDYPEVQFNISHSADLAVCAVGRLPLGVDVEKVRPADFAWTRRILTEKEQRHLERVEGERRDREFFRIWTLKESLAKAVGKGLALDFRKLEFDLCPWEESREIRFQCLSGGGGESFVEENWHFQQTLWQDGYVISLCGREEGNGEILYT